MEKLHRCGERQQSEDDQGVHLEVSAPEVFLRDPVESAERAQAGGKQEQEEDTHRHAS